MTNPELVSDYVHKVQTGQITFDRVRQELVQRGVDEQDIKVIVRLVDDELQSQLLSRSNVGSFNNLIVIGIVVAAIGLIFTIASLAGLFASGSSFVVIIAYGPILAGLAMIFAGWRRRSGKNVKRFGSGMRDRGKDRR
jgi:hypothetical protein